jgi:excisionase family DNA binding protein
VTPASPSASGGGSTQITARTATSPSTERRRLLDIEVLASWLATTPRHIRRLVAERRVPFVKVGHFIRFDPEDITRWIEGQKVLTDADKAGQTPA